MRIFFTTLAAVILLAVSVHAAETPTLELIIKDHKFTPEVLEVPADTKVKLIVNNQDATAEEFESHELRREKVIAGNSKGTLFIGPLKAGEYPFFGEFNPKTAQGKVVVK
jgi:hypothetical protein